MPLLGRENFKRARFAAGPCRNLRNGYPQESIPNAITPWWRRRESWRVGRTIGPRILSDTRSEDVLDVVAAFRVCTREFENTFIVDLGGELLTNERPGPPLSNSGPGLITNRCMRANSDYRSR
jgi:hypothetical protein